METKQPLLSICIPTWNRSKFLQLSLERFSSQLQNVNPDEIEIFVSDNCSDDETPSIVQSFIDLGLPITYSRNAKNVGAAGNFIKCMQWASGKYIWLLGDDDLLKPGSISYLLTLLKGHDYGLVFLHKFKNLEEKEKVYESPEEMLKQISFWITFMSGSIFLKEAVAKIADPQKYISTHLLQVPFYITSALMRTENLIVNQSLMEEGVDSSSNGGYNFYEVFVEGYLGILKEFKKNGQISTACFEFLKKHIFNRFIIDFNYKLLILKKNVSDENRFYIGNRKGFKVKGAWRILFKSYWNCGYFYLSFIKYVRYFLRGDK